MNVRIVKSDGCIFCENEVDHAPLPGEMVWYDNKWFKVSRREWKVIGYGTDLELTIRLETAFGDLDC